jgi:hypothetical protein
MFRQRITGKIPSKKRLFRVSENGWLGASLLKQVSFPVGLGPRTQYSGGYKTRDFVDKPQESHSFYPVWLK